MTKFISAVFGGKSLEMLAQAVARTFIQGFLGFMVAGPAVMDFDITAWEAALGGGITAVIALLHGLVQDPQARQARKEAEWLAAEAIAKQEAPGS